MTYNYQGLKPNYLPEDYEATDDFSPTDLSSTQVTTEQIWK